MNRKEKLRWDLGLILMIMLVIVGQAIQAIPVAIAEGIVQPTGVCLAQSGQTLGMVADNSTHSVTVFNADTDTILGTVFLPGGGTATGDCSITADLTRGFVTDYDNRVWVIDLTTSPLSLASGTNPIPISNAGEDTAISPDQQFLVVCDGGNFQPISVIDIATQTEIHTFDLGSACTSVDVCSGGSVLVTSGGNVRRLTIDGAGNLTDTGEVLSVPNPNNVYCAPGGASGVAINFSPSGEILSFTIPGLGLVDTRPLSGTFGISGLVNPAGNQVFARSNGGAVDSFSYNSATAALSATPLFTIPIADTPAFFGMDQMALHPNGTKLYVSQPGALKVYDASTGTLLTSIPPPPPPPANDDFDNATVVTAQLPFVDEIDTAGATTAPDDPFCVGQSATVWYQFTPTENVRIIAHTFDSNYDTTLSVYTGTRGSLTQIACNDDFNSRQSLVSFDALAGETYFFMISAFDSSPGGHLRFTVDVGLTIDLSIDQVGSVDRLTGDATISGTVTCSKPASVNDLHVELSQPAGRFVTIRGSFSTYLPQCDGVTPWRVTVRGDKGPFIPGPAAVSASAFAYAPETGESAQDSASATVQLKRPRR